MRRHKAFRRPEIIERLKADNHPLVRKAIASLEASKEARWPGRKIWSAAIYRRTPKTTRNR